MIFLYYMLTPDVDCKSSFPPFYLPLSLLVMSSFLLFLLSTFPCLFSLLYTSPFPLFLLVFCFAYAVLTLLCTHAVSQSHDILINNNNNINYSYIFIYLFRLPHHESCDKPEECAQKMDWVSCCLWVEYSRHSLLLTSIVNWQGCGGSFHNYW